MHHSCHPIHHGETAPSFCPSVSSSLLNKKKASDVFFFHRCAGRTVPHCPLIPNFRRLCPLPPSGSLFPIARCPSPPPLGLPVVVPASPSWPPHQARRPRHAPSWPRRQARELQQVAMRCAGSLRLLRREA
jgi:hypothetical protein